MTKITIDNPPDGVQFGNLSPGEAFVYDGHLFIKSKHCVVPGAIGQGLQVNESMPITFDAVCRVRRVASIDVKLER